MTARFKPSITLSFFTIALSLAASLLISGCRTWQTSWDAMKEDVNRGHYQDSRPISHYWN